jgi:hypothetical protein
MMTCRASSSVAYCHDAAQQLLQRIELAVQLRMQFGEQAGS